MVIRDPQIPHPEIGFSENPENLEIPEKNTPQLGALPVVEKFQKLGNLVFYIK